MSINSTKTCIVMHLSKVMFGFECSSIPMVMVMIVMTVTYELPALMIISTGYQLFVLCIAAPHQEHPGVLAEGSGSLVVLGADFRFSGHQEPDSSGGQNV